MHWKKTSLLEVQHARASQWELIYTTRDFEQHKLAILLQPHPTARLWKLLTSKLSSSTWVLACRAVLPVRPDYPAFAPDNFQTVRSLSQKAFDLAQKALAAEPESSVAKRDAAFAHAAVLRWPEGSAFGERRDAAELQYSAALQKFGEASWKLGPPSTSPLPPLTHKCTWTPVSSTPSHPPPYPSRAVPSHCHISSTPKTHL